MVIAVASGKGGTGKTTVAVSLALAAAGTSDSRPLLLDCDVEEPNSGLFLDIDYTFEKKTGVPVPVVDPDRCDFCGTCSEVCVWNAIAVAGRKVLVFRDLCHGCGSCTLACPRGAITEVTHVTGLLEGGSDGLIDFARGTLNVGQAMAVPVISALLENYLPVSDERTVVIDSSPGTSCPMVEAVGSSDYVILVTEPTPFGLHDLKAAVEVVVGQLGLPAGVVINRDGIGNSDVEHYCHRQGLPLLARIPMDRKIAEVLSDGTSLIQGLPEYRDMFIEILEKVKESER
ncbi:MAG: ATP-binding protein [Candidatus Fermentibacteraceae bacterium]|nr:ATP-binding protein [Candidatus Fermentibacteraceae bacterium]MBN2608617.1 ATP-binding protein [Candidatus Fermentibacteraceae bacterium]